MVRDTGGEFLRGRFVCVEFLHGRSLRVKFTWANYSRAAANRSVPTAAETEAEIAPDACEYEHDKDSDAEADSCGGDEPGRCVRRGTVRNPRLVPRGVEPGAADVDRAGRIRTPIRTPGRRRR